MNRIAFNENWTCNGELVTLPHDAMIEEKRSAQFSDGGHAYFPGGIYIYEKRFLAPKEWENKEVFLELEGVYRNATVYLNEEKVYFHAYGYTGFFVPLTKLNIGKENVLKVVADNSKLPNSRWYTGSGIYRPVWLHICERGGLSPESVKITTVSAVPAVLRVKSEVPVRVRVETIVGEGTDFEMTVPDAKLWSAESPNLYTAKICTKENEKDTTEITFGICKITWSKNGLFINGKETLLRGACVHHDHGILGAATYAESEYRRVRILKENGFNAIRSSHNPASKSLLEACDKLGMYLIDETFDMWYGRKTAFDYGCDFEEWWEQDVTSMVKRDENHPSVIMYSIGNEVAEPYEQKGIDAGQEMIDLIHRLDASRPVTCGTNLMIIGRAAKGEAIYKDPDGTKQQDEKKGDMEKEEPKNSSLAFNIMVSFVGTGMNKGGNSKKIDQLTSPFLDALDIAGYNYASGRYPLEEKAHPERVIFGSETFPQDIYKNWKMVERYPYLIGDFMWTGWDYLGEAGIGAWSYTGGRPFNRPYPWLLSGAGVIDILGNPDGSCKYAKTVWGLEKNPVIAVKPVNHPGVRPSKSVWRGTNAILSWGWSGCEGNKAEVEVYSDQAAVELILNGKTVGKKKLKENRAIFKIKYQSGTIRAIAYDAEEKRVGESELSSASGKILVKIRPEKEKAAVGEILYVPVNLEGENGVVESNMDRKLTVSVEGGELLGFGSANPCTEESYQTGSFTTYYGKAMAVVRAGDGTQVKIAVKDGNDIVTENIVIEEKE